MNTIQKTIIVLLCFLLGISMYRSKQEPSRSFITVRFGAGDSTPASPITKEADEAGDVRIVATTSPSSSIDERENAVTAPQFDSAEQQLTSPAPFAITSQYPEFNGSPRFTEPQPEPTLAQQPAQPPPVVAQDFGDVQYYYPARRRILRWRR